MNLESPLPFIFVPTRQRPKTSNVGHATPLLLEQDGSTCEMYVTTGTRSNFHLLPSRNGQTRTALSLCPTAQEHSFLARLVQFLVGVSAKGNPTFDKGSILTPPSELDRVKARFPGWATFPVSLPDGQHVVAFAEPPSVGLYTRIGDYLSVQVWDPAKNVTFLDI